MHGGVSCWISFLHALMCFACLPSLILSLVSQDSTLPNSAQVHAAIQMRLP